MGFEEQPAPHLPPSGKNNSRDTTEPQLVADCSGKVLSLNQSFAQLSGYTLETLAEKGGLEQFFESVSIYREVMAAINDGKNWDGHALFLNALQDEFVARIRATPYTNGYKQPCIAIGFFDVARSKKNAQLETRLLKAITQCTEILFSRDEPYIALPRLLETIGQALHVHRCHIYENETTSGIVVAERKYLWLKKGVPGNKKYDKYNRLDYTHYSNLYKALSAGQDVSATPRTSTQNEYRQIMQETQINSFLIIPIYKNELFWGFISFDDLENQREWSRSEKNALKTLAHNIGAFLRINDLTEELITKNRQLENAIAGSTDGLWVCDMVTGSMYLSPKMYDIFGYSSYEWPQDIAGIKNLLKTEDTEVLENTLSKTIHNRLPGCEFETVAKHKKGKYIWLKGSVSFVYDRQGNVIKHSGSFSDISTEKTYEIKIRKQEEHYQRLVNSLKEVVFETDIEGNITFLNNSWKNLTGQNIRASLGKKLSQFIAPEYAPVLDNVFRHLREKLSWPGRLELQVLRNGKEGYWTEIWLRGLYDSHYELTGVSGSIFDINTKKMALQQLVESEERYRLLSENTKDIVCLHDDEGRFIYISPSMREVIGLQPKLLIGRYPWECIHPDDMGDVQESFKRLTKGREVGFVRYRVKHRKGHYVWVETVANMQNHALETDGKKLLQTATRDISEQKKAEEEIKNALEKEKQLVELRTNLINMISHEFRTPLTTIKSSSDLLLKYLPMLTKSDVKDRFGLHFERIKGQVNRINDLISGVLLLGRMDTGKIEFQPEETDIIEYVKEFLKNYRETHPEDSREITVHTEGTPTPVKIDPLLVNHVLRNLISNALKYSPGKRNPELYVKFESKIIKITIKDYGIGIANADRVHLFQSFYRGGNALTIPGTGLGLVIVKQFVEMHGGSVTLDSKLNQGTTIQVTLPINEP